MQSKRKLFFSVSLGLGFCYIYILLQVRKGHSKISQQDIIDVLDKQLLEGMGVLLTEEEQQKCEASVSAEIYYSEIVLLDKLCNLLL